MKTKTPFVNGFMVMMLLLSSVGSAPFASAFFVSVPEAPDDSTMYVVPGGAGDCTSWESACELKPALNAAASGDEIWVQEGVYKPDFWENLTDFTFVAWVYWNGGGSWQRIFDFGKDTDNFMELTPSGGWGTMQFEIKYAGAWQEIIAPDPLSTDSWEHVALTLSGDRGSLYLNGSLVISNTITYEPWQVTGDNLWVGRAQFAGPYYFNGLIDEVALFNRALSQSEIVDVRDNGWENVPGKVLALHLEENPASNDTTLLDSFELAYGGILKTNNGPDNKSVPGHDGQALSLDGDEDYITLKTRREGTFNLKNGVSLYGGFDGTEIYRDQRDWVNNVTVLSGDIDDNDLADPHGVITTTQYITGTNSYHVVRSYWLTDTTLMDGFIITGGSASEVVWPHIHGGGLLNESSSLILNHMTFSGNQATTYGGGLYNLYSSLTMMGSTFSGNQGGVGGGFFNNFSSTAMADSEITGNHATDCGGGIYNKGSLDIINSRVEGNIADVCGGGIANVISNLTMVGSTFTGNQAGTSGGGLYSRFSDLAMENSIFSGNQSGDYGGGIFHWDGTLTVTDSTFTGNQATYVGGGIAADDGTVTITASTFSSNTAVVGGGIANEGTLTLVASTIGPENNVSSSGGGIFNMGEMKIFDSTIIGNSGTGTIGGAGIDTHGTLDITNSTVSGNYTNVDGGGIFLSSGSLALTNTTITANIADYDQDGYGSGGGIYSSFSTITVKNTIIANNPRGSDCAVDGATSLGHNIDSDGTCHLTELTDLPNTDPLLAGLADNGGLMLTHLPLAGSPAIDAADPAACPVVDQRGVFRPVDGDGDGNAVCDIGSVEYQLSTTTTITGDDPDPSLPGHPFTMTVLVTATVGVPTGVVTVTVSDSPAFCSATLVDGLGGCMLDLDSAGVYTVTATYAGDWTYAPSSDTESHAVIPVTTITIITGDAPDPSAPGEPFDVSFSVYSILGGAFGPATVTVSDSPAICTTDVVYGAGSCALTLATTGVYTLTAVFEGEGNYGPSSDTETHTVQAAGDWLYLPVIRKN